MARLKPLNDFIFQKLMGEQGSEDELKAFLSAVLGRNLKEVTILENKTLTSEIIGDKTSILDVRATTDDNTHINVEVQINPYKFMDIRSLFYWSKLYSIALEAGEDYRELPNVITINILDYNNDFIKLERFHTKFHLWEDTERYKLTDAVEIHFIEMVRFRKLTKKDLINDPLHRWLTYFDEQTDESIIEEVLAMDAAIQKTNDRLKFLSQDKEFLHRANLRDIALSDYTSAMNDAKDEGGEARAVEIATKMLKRRTPVEYIIEDTGLSEEKIKKISI